MEVLLPTNLDEVKGGEQVTVGMHQMRCSKSEVKPTKDGLASTLYLTFEALDQPNSYDIMEFISLPHPLKVQGMAGSGCTIPAFEGRQDKKLTAAECEKHVGGAMAGLAKAIKGMEMPYNVDDETGVSSFDPENAVDCVFDVEVVLKAASYKDKQPALPITDPTAPDPNEGREMWQEGRNIKWAPLPVADEEA